MRACVGLLAVVVLSACLSFKINIPDEPEATVDYLAIVKAVDKDGNYNKAIGNDIIHANDPAAYALIKVLRLNRPLLLQWHWYNPQGQLLLESKAIEVNANKKYLEFFVAWDSLPGSYFTNQKGKWLVVITADGTFLAKGEFTIQD